MKFLKNIALVAVAAMSVVSCEKTDIDNLSQSTDEGTVLYATTASESKSKISFEDNTDTIDLKWEDDDVFEVKTGEGIYITFTYSSSDSDGTTAKFTAEDGATLKEGTYTAYYNREASFNTQDGSKINSLNNACTMEATFTYTEGTSPTITFEHTAAIMTFEFTSSVTPSKLVFQNGSSATYTVTGLTPSETGGTGYTAYIMVQPCNATSRELIFTLYKTDTDTDTNTDIEYDVRKVTTSKAYLKGCRYSANFTEALEDVCENWSGTGTESDPYIITNATQLRKLSTDVNKGEKYSGKYFQLGNDIDLGGLDIDGVGVATNEFIAIGYHYTGSVTGNYTYPFSGIFDGNNKTISGLYISSGEKETAYQGLFGYIYDATIKNLTVSGSVTPYAYYVGGIVGDCISSTITNCCSNVTVSGYYAGGIVGYCGNSSVVTNCFNTGTVSGDRGNSQVGGIVGWNISKLVANCYNSGTLVKSSTGSTFMGGIVGHNQTSDGVITNCYNSVTLSDDTYTGGIIGRNSINMTETGSINYCYYPNTTSKGVGNIDEDAVNAGFIDTSVDMSTDEMMSQEFVYLLNTNAYNYNEGTSVPVMACAWKYNSGSYPTLDFDTTPIYSMFYSGTGTEGDPYVIANFNNLLFLSESVNSGTSYSGKYFTQTADITIPSGKDFAAIGSSSSFSGTYNGNNFTISGLNIDKSGYDHQGLFGRISGATIKYVTVYGSVTGKDWVGGIVGYSTGSTVTYCNNYATVTGHANNTDGGIGGIVGENYNHSEVTCCKNYGTVSAPTGDAFVGGIAGNNNYRSSVVNCGNSGAVSGASGSCIGGVVGENQYLSSMVANCYNTGAVSGGSSSSNCGIGGIVGYSSSSYITSCYNSAAVTGDSGSDIGGIVGYSDSSTITYSYYNSDVNSNVVGSSYKSSPSNCNGYSSSTMKGSSFVGYLNTASDYYNTDYSSYPRAYSWMQESDGYPILFL